METPRPAVLTLREAMGVMVEVLRRLLRRHRVKAARSWRDEQRAEYNAAIQRILDQAKRAA